MANSGGLRNTVREILSLIKEKSVVREAWDKTLLFTKVLCGLHVTNTYLGTISLTYGPSMLPTLSVTGDWVLIERISTQFGLVGPGDIVQFRSPQNPRIVVTKRLIGLEGHSVTYVVEPGKTDGSETIVVPKGHVWVEGDNIYDSKDSRKFGPIPYGLLQGKICCRIWPPKDFASSRSRTKDPILDEDLSSAETI